MKLGSTGFLGLLLTSFLVVWMVLVVLPWEAVGHLQPIHDASSTDILPFDKPNEAHQGEMVYAANGCVYCHTQQVRAATSGADFVRGWGTGGVDEKNVPITRRTYPRDYIWNGQVFLGNSREGADLTNLAARITSADELYRYLYNPADSDGHGSMPAYRFLFQKRRVAGQPSADALTLPSDDAAPAGYEIIPSPEAKALVAYLLSLKNDYHLPDEKGPVPASATSPAKS